MIDFMIIGLPRTGTTWAANFFNTEHSICLHDPLYNTHYENWDSIRYDNKKVGISCTGIWRFQSFLRNHPAKKIILRRPLGEVNYSLEEIGLPPCSVEDQEIIETMTGHHFAHTDLFNSFYMQKICKLLELPFDADRHAQLVQIEMQPKFSGLTIGPEVTRRLVAEITESLRG